MVRDEPHRVCTQATLGAHGKRQSDSTIELHIVVPPDQFSRYEASVQFAMTLPSGMIALTLPDPLVASHYSDKPRHLLSHGQSCLMEGLEIVVSRAKVTKFTRRDLQVERRAPRIVEAPAHVLNDHGDEWYLFRREEAEEKDIF